MQYDDWASKYDQDTERFGWCAPKRLLEAVTERMPPGPSLRVLDLGVGTGQCSAPFLDAGASVVGIDAAAAMLEQAARRGPFDKLAQVKLGEDRLSDHLGADARFEIVVACGVLHFVAELPKLLLELRSVVAPGGLLAITTIPEQARTFGPSTRVAAPAVVREWLQHAGFSVHTQSDFIAYYDQADENDPVLYTLSVATA